MFFKSFYPKKDIICSYKRSKARSIDISEGMGLKSGQIFKIQSEKNEAEWR